MATMYSRAGGLACLHRVDMFPQTHLPDHILATLDANGKCPIGTAELLCDPFTGTWSSNAMHRPHNHQKTTSKDGDLGWLKTLLSVLSQVKETSDAL